MSCPAKYGFIFLDLSYFWFPCHICCLCICTAGGTPMIKMKNGLKKKKIIHEYMHTYHSIPV